MHVARRSLYACFLSLSVLASAPARADGTAVADIVSVQGTGQSRADATAAWQDAAVHQELAAGNYVRTGEHSRMGLLFRDRTQLRLNERTTLQVKDVGAQTRLRLESGRAWTQSRTVPDRLYMETPSATAAVRGTDWELEVDDDGRTVLTVFSGEVEFSNDLGSLRVGADQAAEARIGQAPVRLQLVRPRDRVQWVTGWRLAPLKEIGRIVPREGNLVDAALAALEAGDLDLARERLAQADAADTGTQEQNTADSERRELALAALAILESRPGDAQSRLEALVQRNDLAQPAAWLLLAGLHNQGGRNAEAIAVLQQALARFPDDARIHAALARTWLAMDARADSRAAVERALAADPHATPALLARGDLSRIEGDTATAMATWDDVIARDPAEDRAWFERGRMRSDAGDLRRARNDLRQALSLDPHGAGYAGELGTLETRAGDFGAARDAFEIALESSPDDYVALTGRGLRSLARGHTEDALHDFLRAGLMEPRYARVHVYAAVAYYQQGYPSQALAELARAAQLDDKDPLPHFMASQIHGDLRQPAAAIASAREAMRLLPYLKSLDLLANDPDGSANLGRAFADAGLEEWAMRYAQDSYDSLWAGSHLFLAERYPGLYTRNSELFQGFLADPVVFGAGDRFRSLLPRPGSHLGLQVRGASAHDVAEARRGQLKANGYANAHTPLAWFAQRDGGDVDLEALGPYDTGETTLALGTKPREDIGLFVFANRLDRDYRLDKLSPSPADPLVYDHDSRHGHLGLHVRFSPHSQLWLKGGRLEERDTITGDWRGRGIDSPSDVVQPEWALRHTFAAGAHEFTWGYEQGSRRVRWQLSGLDPFFRLPDLTPYYRTEDAFQREESRDAFLSWRWQDDARFLLQVDAFHQDHERRSDYTRHIRWDPANVYLDDWLHEEQPQARWQPRIGLMWRLREGLQGRIAHQRWQRPATFSSLGPVATAGIPLDDRMVLRGGELVRTRAQLEWEASNRDYLLAWADHRNIDNQPFRFTPFSLAELTALGNLHEAGIATDDLLEFPTTPQYEAGRLRSAGFAYNRLLGERWSVAARYARHDGENTGTTFAGNALPYIPHWLGALAAHWTGAHGFGATVGTVYRTERYEDEANTFRWQDGFNGTAGLTWESRDKRWEAHAQAVDLLDPDLPTQYLASLTYRP